MKKKILKATVPTFSGFTPETMAFLHRLAQNNNRDWFNANKVEFERVAVTPALDLIELDQESRAATCQQSCQEV